MAEVSFNRSSSNFSQAVPSDGKIYVKTNSDNTAEVRIGKDDKLLSVKDEVFYTDATLSEGVWTASVDGLENLYNGLKIVLNIPTGTYLPTGAQYLNLNSSGTKRITIGRDFSSALHTNISNSCLLLAYLNEIDGNSGGWCLCANYKDFDSAIQHSLENYLPLSGGTMLGGIDMNGESISNLSMNPVLIDDRDAANVKYVNDKVEEYVFQNALLLTGNSHHTPITGEVFLDGNHTISGVPDPTQDDEVASKHYVDQHSGSSMTIGDDVLISAIDGTKDMQFCYFSDSRMMLGFSVPMLQGSCIHVFAVNTNSSHGAAGAVTREITIDPQSMNPCSVSNDVIRQVYVNGILISQAETIQIPSREMVEISIMADSVFGMSEKQYQRIVIKYS